VTEPDVTITDYLLALESLVLAGLLLRAPEGRADLASGSIYAAVGLAVTDAFWIAIVSYLSSTLFLLVVYSGAYLSHPHHAIAIGVGGLVRTLAAAAAQRLGITLHPVYFNHNALYQRCRASPFS
jgi:hypothetical protein